MTEVAPVRDPISMEFVADFSSYFSWILEVWNFEISVIDGRAITISKITKGITLFIIGYFICKTVSYEIDKRVLSRFEIETSLRHSLRTIIFYFMLIILTLFVLQLINIPITVFTVLGGALALGVGLGSQNIVKDFISGLVIMVEAPVKVGDIVDLGHVAGRVEIIGARSTRVKTMENTHVVVPNSSFLETNVLNWTLSDDVVRSCVQVGVAYGSDTEKVEVTLKEALKGQDRILKYPEPMILFSKFGDNALIFDLYYWTHVHNLLQLKLLESNVRHRVDTLLKENNITIAFPQRDVHLDTVRPLQVQLFKGDGGAGEV